MDTATPSLLAESIYHSFGTGDLQVDVLQGVGLDLYPGQVLCLIGPSGSGKTVLLAVLGGLLRPRAGRVLVLGQNLWQMPDAARRHFRLAHFGFIFQGSNLFPGLTVWQQLEMVLRWGEEATAAAAQRQVQATLEQFGLTGKEDRFPEQLSGGEKQRVAVARALIRQPDFCFADEPTAALDWANGQQVMEQLKSARDRGASVLLVTHDPRLLAFADRVFYQEDGRLSQQPGKAALPWSPAQDTPRKEGPPWFRACPTA